MELETRKPDWIGQDIINPGSALACFRAINQECQKEYPLFDQQVCNALEQLSSIYYACHHLNALEKKYQLQKKRAINDGITVVQHWFSWYKDTLKQLLKRCHEKESGGYDSDDSIFHGSLLNNNPNSINLLFEFGHKPALYKYSLLRHTNDVRIASLLIANGEDVNKLSSSGFHYFVRLRDSDYSPKLLELILKKNANVEWKDELGTALHWLVHETPSTDENYDQTIKKIELLLDHKLAINELNDHNQTALNINDQRIKFWYDYPEYKTRHQKIGEYLRSRGAKTAAALAKSAV
jgi:hypothetical protein